VPFCTPHAQNETETYSQVIHDLEYDFFKTMVDPKEVAAFVLEPIQGEGGYIMPTKFFLQELRRLCDTHGILLIYDEVQSGIGRTGHMFASEYFGVYPDIYTSAKGIASGMPIGAIVAKSSVMTWGRGTHGSTYGGNPLACEAALATLDIIEGILPEIRSNGEQAMAKLKKLAEKYPVMGDVRGTGYMIGVKFVHPKTKKPLADYMEDVEMMAFSKGLLLLGCGTSTIRLSPPLIVTQHEIDIMLKIMEECIIELNKKYGF